MTSMLSLTDSQFRTFEQLCALMDSDSITPYEAARRGLADGMHPRYVATLTGLTLATVYSLTR